MPHLSPEQLNSLRTQLITEKRHIEHRLAANEHYGLGDSMKLQTGELSPIDTHPGDVGTELYERAKDISLLEHDEFQVERIASALQSMDEGR
ncbi:molecular chaperone DnaK, partial [Escherichia coli]|nr:molecular chaperone DnaK [Escherichia coli]